MKTKLNLLYNLPYVLLTEYLRDLGVSELPTEFVTDLPYVEGEVACKQIKLPGSSSKEEPTLLLIDKGKGLFRSVELLILTRPVNRQNLLACINNSLGQIVAKCTSATSDTIQCGDIGESYNISVGSEPNRGYTRFSFGYSTMSNVHYFELSKRGQELFCSEEYDWVNKYFISEQGECLALEIKTQEVNKKIPITI